MVTMQFRVPEKLITVAEWLDIPYKKTLRRDFEQMICVSILTKRGETSCEICENVIERNRIIDEQLKKTLADMAAKLLEDQKAETEMAGIIQRARQDGKSRGEAEMEYGRVFPDDIWKKYGEKP